MGFRGFNCTIPHKVAVIEHLDGLGESASLMGAVNCVVRRGDQLIGENTDGKGFVKSLRELVDPTGKHVVMFGAGGAARAIGVEVALAGATKITLINRSATRGEQLAQLLADRVKVDVKFVRWTIPAARIGSRRWRGNFLMPTSSSTRPRLVCIPMSLPDSTST